MPGRRELRVIAEHDEDVALLEHVIVLWVGRRFAGAYHRNQRYPALPPKVYLRHCAADCGAPSSSKRREMPLCDRERRARTCANAPHAQQSRRELGTCTRSRDTAV